MNYHIKHKTETRQGSRSVISNNSWNMTWQLNQISVLKKWCLVPIVVALVISFITFQHVFITKNAALDTQILAHVYGLFSARSASLRTTVHTNFTRLPTKDDEVFTEYDRPSTDRAGALSHQEISSIKYNTSKYKAVRLCTSEERSQHIQKMCSLYNNFKLAPQAKDSEFLVSSILNISYCFTAKCGSSAFLRFLGLLAPRTEETKDQFTNREIYKPDIVSAHRLKLYNVNTFKEHLRVVRQYKKVFIMRHPLARLLSAYVDRIPHNKIPIVLNPIRKFFGLNESVLPDFATFIEYLTSDGHKENMHWSPVGAMCRPCDSHDAYVLRVETLDEDMAPLLQLWNLSNGLFAKENVRASNSSQLITTSASTVGEMKLTAFANIPRRDIDRLIEDYKYDFLLGGYHYDVDTQTAYCGITTKSGDVCC